MPPCSRSLRKLANSVAVNRSLSLLMRSCIPLSNIAFSNMAVITSDSDLNCVLDSSAALQVACNLTAAPAFYSYIRKSGCFRFIKPLCISEVASHPSRGPVFSPGTVSNAGVPEVDTQCQFGTRSNPRCDECKMSSFVKPMLGKLSSAEFEGAITAQVSSG